MRSHYLHFTLLYYKAFGTFNFPLIFSYTSKEFYTVLLTKVTSVPILPSLWTPFVPRFFSLRAHWEKVCDNFTSNHKNDLAWLITLRAVKVRDSLRNWGYISSPRCASCSRIETIDHCFLNCPRAKSVWLHFCLLYTSPSPRDLSTSRMPSSA